MASSTISTDRRWASSSRKSGMTVLGKVPKPINLPSQRLENNGLDPNVEIVPKGTITWGTTRPTSSSSPSPNAWSTNTNPSSSLLSPKPSSPCTEPGRPVSSGSSPHTRPSTGSNTDGNLSNWSDLRPNSSSGVLAMGQVAVLSQSRPRSADTRPGSGQLSRFAEASDKLGAATYEGGFTLSSGDFPTLGSEKPSEQRGHSSQGRPKSRDATPKETLDAPLSGHNLHGRPMSASHTDPRPKTPNTGDYSDPRTQTQTTQNVNILKTEDPSNSWYQSPNPYQSRPNLNPHAPAPLHYDSSWRAPPPQEPMWYGPTGPHGPAGPHGPTGPHGPAGPHVPSGPQYRPAGAYPIDPFVYYQPAPPHQFRAPTPSAESAATRPHLVQNPYLIPTHIPPARPGAHAPPHAACGPGSYDAGYYGPPRTGFYGNPNHHHQNHNAPHQNTNHDHNNNHNYNKNNNNNQQQGILSQYGEKPVSSSSSSVDAGQKQYKVLLKHREKKDEIVPPAVKSGDHSSETGSEKQNESQKKKDPLIQKIEGLNSKMRSLELVKEEKVKKQHGEGILATPVSETGGSSYVRTGDDVERRANNEQRKAETGTDSVETGGNDGTVSEANLDPLDPAQYEIQRLKLKEKAAQRARELQREEEERIRQQRAKALAKLEELDRRANLQKEPPNSANEKRPPQQEAEESTKVTNDTHSEPSKITSDANMQKEPSKILNEANVQKEPPIVRNDTQQEPTKVIADSHFPKELSKVANDVHLQKEPRKFANDNKHLQKEPRKFPNEKHHHQREKQKVINDPNFQKEPSKSTNEKHPQQDPPKSTTDTNLQKEPLKFSNEKQILQKVTETSSVPTTVTLSFGTFSGVQINSHEISVPTIVSTVQEPVPVSSHAKPHHHKNQTGYKKKHNNSSNDSSETGINEKSSNILTGSEPQNESQHKRRGNKNPKNKNKSDETVPVEERVEKSSDESKHEKNPNLKPIENPNPKQPHENPNFHNNNKGGGNWKPQASRRPVRNPRNIPDKSHTGETVMWAPVKQSTKTNQSEESSNHNNTTVHNQSETETQIVNNASGKTKRAEMERYVPKPQLERKLDEPTGEVLPPPVESKTGEEGDNSSGANNNNNNRSFRRGKPNSSWRQRAVVPVEQVPVKEENKNTNTESVQDAKDFEGNRKRNNYSGHKFYTATGNNYSGQGNSSNSGGIDVNMNEIGGEQHWKPKAQNKASNWQKVGNNDNEEGIMVNSTQKGNEKSDNRGFAEQKETNWIGTGEVGLEGRPSRSYHQRGRGRGRNGNFARE